MLSDKDKKKQYDSGQMDFDDGAGGFEDGGMGGMGGMGGHGGMRGNMQGVDPNEIFKMFFNQGGFGGGGMDGFEGMFSNGASPGGFKFTSFGTGGKGDKG